MSLNNFLFGYSRFLPENLGELGLINYLTVLSQLCAGLAHLRNLRPSYGALAGSSEEPMEVEESEDSDEEDDESKAAAVSLSESEVRCLRESLLLLNDPDSVQSLIQCVSESSEPTTLNLFCHICHSVLMADKNAIHK